MWRNLTIKNPVNWLEFVVGSNRIDRNTRCHLFRTRFSAVFAEVVKAYPFAPGRTRTSNLALNPGAENIPLSFETINPNGAIPRGRLLRIQQHQKAGSQSGSHRKPLMVSILFPRFRPAGNFNHPQEHMTQPTNAGDSPTPLIPDAVPIDNNLIDGILLDDPNGGFDKEVANVE
jgi:hypothetical protein